MEEDISTKFEAQVALKDNATRSRCQEQEENEDFDIRDPQWDREPTGYATLEILEKLRENFLAIKARKKSYQWGKQKISDIQSSVAHFEYDFTGGFARRIDPVQEDEVESLGSQMKVMSVETKAEKKKRIIEKMRKDRSLFKQGGVLKSHT